MIPDKLQPEWARPAGTDNPRVLWISLAAGVRVCLEDGFVCWEEVPGHG